PYDENHIIGFGKDTVEVKGNAFYLGMKMAVFNVSDVTNPKELFTEKIGDRGTDSELLRNHKALLFSKENNLLAFPVTLMEIKNGQEKYRDGYPQYGQFSFQGAFVYNIDLSKGFSLKGRITHLSKDDYSKAGDHWYNSEKNVERILYIGDKLYTLSQGKIKVNQMSDLKDIKEIEIH
ncbi:MAG: beta-propeller domain-containing protein, partial [Clostridia bacterium]|nr:beta-propeller domain-containing protein [Clostridia bacterium]